MQDLKDEKDNDRLNDRIRDFFNVYAPTDKPDRLDFEVDLFELIRAIAADAAWPYQRQLAAMVFPTIIPAEQTPKKGE